MLPPCPRCRHGQISQRYGVAVCLHCGHEAAPKIQAAGRKVDTAARALEPVVDALGIMRSTYEGGQPL